jgi:hypothetical protein
MPKKETKTEKVEVKKKEMKSAKPAVKKSAVKPAPKKKTASVKSTAAVKSAKKNDTRVKRSVPQKSVQSSGGVSAARKNDQDEGFFLKWIGKDFLRTAFENHFYFFSLAVSILMAAWEYYNHNSIAVITFVLLIFVIVFELISQPKDIDYGISIDGFLIGDRLYRFEGVRSFELIKRGDSDVIRIQLRNSFFPIKELILSGEQDMIYLQNLLEYFLPEEKMADALFNFGGSERSADEEFINQKVDEYLGGKY